MTSDVPTGWEMANLGDVVEFLDSMRVPVSDEERNRQIAGKAPSKLFPYYGANGQVGWIDNYLFDEPLVLLAEDGGFFETIGRVAYTIEGKTWVNNHAHALRPMPGIDIRYLLYALNSQNLMPFVSGTTRLKLNQSNARRIPIPLAPEEEQVRIAEKVEELFVEIKSTRHALTKIQPNVKQFRQAVLTRAFRGELTERNPNDEPAQDLLRRIRQELRKKSEEELEARDKDPKKYVHEESEINAEGWFNLPDSWAGSTLGSITIFIGSGITPLGGQNVYVSKGIPFIRSQNVHPDGLHLDDVAYVTPKMHAEMKRTHVRPGDVLLNITGASIGRSTYVPEGFGEANVNQHVCIIRTGWWMDPTYLSSFLNSPLGQEQIFSTESGVTREGLNYGQIRSLKIPIAPLNEQKLIGKIIAEMFAKATAVERVVQEELEQTESLERSILSRAFRGKLVAQDPKDEPVHLLLERIRGERSVFTRKERRSQAILEVASSAKIATKA